ncbi:hypothetical protein H4R20_004108, partial [Coemansia guatemalensis]
EGWGPLSPTNSAHLTTCFQHGLLAPCLNALFLVAAAVRMRRLSTMPPLPAELVTGRIFSAKLLLATAALLASAAELVAMAIHFPYINTYTLSLTLQTAALAVAVWLHYKEQLYNRIASTPLLLFWLFTIMLSLLRLRTAASIDYVNEFNGLAYPVALFTVASLAVFALECQPKPDKLFEPSGNDTDDVDNNGFGKLEDCDDDYCTAGSPEERANVFSRYTYTWVGSILQKAYHKQLNLEDIWKLTGQYRPDVVHARFQESWQKELRSSCPSLFWATARAYWSIWALLGLHLFLKTAASILQPVLLSRLIEFSATYGTDQGSPIEHGYFYAVALFLAACEMNVGCRLLVTHGQRIKTFTRTSYMAAIYQKLFALSNNSRQKFDIGRIITHITIDLENIAVFLEEDSHDLWCDPLRIIVCLLMLYQMLGWSALAGVFIMLACSPVISRIGQTIGARSKRLMGYRDQRMGIISEVLAGIRVIKMYAWESAFIRRINDVRINLELEAIRKNNVLKAITRSAVSMMPYLVLFATFGTYSVFDNSSRGPLDARLVFVALPLLNLARLSLRRAPQTIPNIIKARASFCRITKFLTATEIYFSDIDRQPYNRDSSGASVNDSLISINNATFKWFAADTPALRNIIIECKRKELIAIIGRVGCGKSSLVSAILGDMIKCAGEVTVRGSIAYVAQQPWILNATLRDNILFGSDYDEEFYGRVIDACALWQDIDALPAGDMTEIGERGINLSGGQKMRVSLARAIYARADVYILDDPLAAVDAYVGEHLFKHVIGPQGILRARARILVTNAVEYLDYVDNIVMLRDGRIIERGTSAEAMSRQGDIFDFVHHQIAAYSSTENNSVASADEYNAGGTSTIRAYAQQSRFISQMEHCVGQYIRVDNAYVLLNQWLAMRLETIGNMLTLATSLLMIGSAHYSGSGDADAIGLAVGSTLMLSIAVNWTVRHYGDMQMSMTHLERATEYAELTPEADDVIEDHRPKEAWPKQGMVEFKDYSMRYRDGLDLSLKDLSFCVQPGQKVGIVGRTGAGKSSLTLALFRIIEAAGGQILLDGEDISKYGLFDVRSKLSIIPQDPVLFAGAVRENLDPFNSYSDQDIWRALEQAHLADYIRSKDERLEFMVSQSGENFSVGQRQLICLARALLKHAKVLVLDEATAAIDKETDAIIQQTIRSEFRDCTVLTIAHRLNTVIDSDMVLVIEDGQLAEYDTPHNLLANNDSILSKLIKKAQASSN